MTHSSDDESRPRLTVVTVNRNMRDGLARTMRSVREQPVGPIEHVIVDGASTDGSPALLAEAGSVASGHALRWISGPDGGIYDAMNKGVCLASGTWLLFLNAGDVLVGPSALEALLGATTAGDADILYGDAEIAYGDGSRAFRRALPIGEMPRRMPFAHAAALVRRDLLLARPYERDGQASDFAFFLGCYLDGCRFRYVPGAIATIEADGISDRRRLRSTVERWKAIRRYDCGSPSLAAWYAQALLRDALARPVARLVPPPIRRRLRGARTAP